MERSSHNTVYAKYVGLIVVSRLGSVSRQFRSKFCFVHVRLPTDELAHRRIVTSRRREYAGMSRQSEK